MPALAQRLISEGYLPAQVTLDDDLYGADLVAAVKVFQQQHALQADGVVGAATLEALNVSPAQRLAQLRLNLERWRWLARDLQRAWPTERGFDFLSDLQSLFLPA